MKYVRPAFEDLLKRLQTDYIDLGMIHYVDSEEEWEKIQHSDYLDYVMDKLDVILLMSVNPGFGGQSFIPQTLDKLREVRRRIDESGFDIRLEVDGGVKVNNIGEIAAAGADMFVAGSAIFDQPDYKKVIDEMRSELAKVSHE